MDNLLIEFYKRYGNHINSSRAFPLVIDGLIPVERRVLLTSYLTARNSFVKSARITGTCMARFHPHSECYGTIVKLVRQGFLDGQGNFGNNLGQEPSPPAAHRYTECRLSKKMDEMVFKYINYVDFVESELDDEPIFLPTMFPLCILGTEYFQGIGFGFKTYIPCYKLEDLKKRLYWNLNPKLGKPIIRPITNCDYLSKDDDFETLLTTGSSTINVVGKLIHDEKNLSIILKSWPPGKRFESILEKVKSKLDNMIGYVDASNDANGTHIIFSVLKQRNTLKIYTDLYETLKKEVTGSIPFKTIVVNPDKSISFLSIDKMLIETFKMFRLVNERMLITEINKNNKIIYELNNLEKIRIPLSKILSETILKEDNINSSCERISNESGVSKEEVKELVEKYKIKKLFTISTNTSEIEKETFELTDNLKNINTFVIKQYTQI